MHGRIVGSIVGLMLAILALGSCSNYSPDGAPPSQIRPPITHPGGNKIFFRGEESKHVVTLREDGSYLFETGNSYGRIISKREGRWTWKRAGTHDAQLALDTDIWQLKFVDHQSAVAVNQSVRGRTHVFQFERPGAERSSGPMRSSMPSSLPSVSPEPLPVPLPGPMPGSVDVPFTPGPAPKIDRGSVPSLPML